MANKDTSKEPLPSLPWIEAVFVKASLDKVAAYFRGWCASTMARDTEDDDFWSGDPMAAIAESLPSIPDRTLYEVSGAAAGIAQPFGPDVQELSGFARFGEDISWLPQKFPVRGSHRISVVRSNPAFVMIEGAMNGALNTFAETLHRWTGDPALRVWSHTGPNPMLDLPVMLRPNSSGPDHGFSLHAAGTKRWVHVQRRNRRLEFHSHGPVQPFENPGHYQKRFMKDRLSRAILFQYLVAFGLDPISIFERRELDDPLLYTSDHPGQDCSTYQAERGRGFWKTTKTTWHPYARRSMVRCDASPVGCAFMAHRPHAMAFNCALSGSFRQKFHRALR